MENLFELHFPKGTLITTRDNPYDPFTEYDKWYMWDVDHGYNTANYQARLVNLPIDTLDYVLDKALDEAKKEILENDPFDIYIVIDENYFKDKRKQEIQS